MKWRIEGAGIYRGRDRCEGKTRKEFMCKESLAILQFAWLLKPYFLTPHLDSKGRWLYVSENYTNSSSSWLAISAYIFSTLFFFFLLFCLLLSWSLNIKLNSMVLMLMISTDRSIVTVGYMHTYVTYIHIFRLVLPDHHYKNINDRKSDH